MTPSNQDNQQPLIYRICDSAGVFHLVAPVNHHHSQNEIDGLAASLAAKQDVLTFDTAPTANSTNPVTSGGVKTELNKISALIRSIGNTDSTWQTIIKIDGAVSEGTETGAVDNNTHAEGAYTVAAGRASHAEGNGGGDEVEIDVAQLWVVRNPIDDQGEIDDHSLYVSCGAGYVVDQLVSIGDVIMYRGAEEDGQYQYAKVQEIGAVAGEENLFELLLSSPIKVNVTSDSRSKTLYKVPNGAFGIASHVEGLGTVAKANYQHVQGKYNVADTNGDYAYIIGNGTADDERSNAFAVKWDGTVVVWKNGTPIELSPASLAALITPDTTPTANSTNLVTSGGVKAALDGKTGISRGNNGWVEVKENGEVEIIGDQSVFIGISDMDGVSVTLDNIANLKRALLNPDPTPTANSNNLVTSGGVKNALDGKADQNHMHSSIGDEESSIRVGEGEINIELSDPVTHSGGELDITVSKLPNLQRATNNPDTTPTANSTNLVTSGGVKAALDGKAPQGDTEVIFDEGENLFVYLPTYFTNGERQRSFILDYQGDVKGLIDLFGCDTYDAIHILSHDDSIIMVGQCYIAVRVIKQTGGSTQGDAYFIIFDGKIDY